MAHAAADGQLRGGSFGQVIPTDTCIGMRGAPLFRVAGGARLLPASSRGPAEWVPRIVAPPCSRNSPALAPPELWKSKLDDSVTPWAPPPVIDIRPCPMRTEARTELRSYVRARIVSHTIFGGVSQAGRTEVGVARAENLLPRRGASEARAACDSRTAAPGRFAVGAQESRRRREWHVILTEAIRRQPASCTKRNHQLATCIPSAEKS